MLTRKWSTKTLKCKLFPQVQSKTDWCKGRYDWKRILYLVRLKVRLLVIGCRHSSVDSSALYILPPQLRLPSTPATLLSFIVDFVLYLSLKCDKRTKINKKRPGFGTFFEKILHIIWPIKLAFTHLWICLAIGNLLISIYLPKVHSKQNCNQWPIL